VLKLTFSNLHYFIQIPNCNVKNELSENVNFINYLVMHLKNNCLDNPNDLENDLSVEVEIFAILTELVRKNSVLRKYLTKVIGILPFMNRNCFNRTCFFNSFLKSGEEVSKLLSSPFYDIFILQKTYIFTIFRFLREYISKDTNIINCLKLSCENIQDIIILLIESHGHESLKSLVSLAYELYETIYKSDFKTAKQFSELSKKDCFKAY